MIRLFVSGDLGRGARLAVTPAQAHYLVNVMRLATADELLVFNGRDGEWRARIADAGRRGCTLEILDRTRAQAVGPDLDLVVALVKRNRLETIVEKAAELGARRVRLVTTERTNAERANVARLGAIAVEASEQTGRLEAPDVIAPVKLERLLADWPAERGLMFCDEAGDAPPALAALTGKTSGPWALLIGPEGG